MDAARDDSTPRRERLSSPGRRARVGGFPLRTTHATLCVLALFLAAAGPLAAAPAATAASCSPIPHVVDVQCLPVPYAGSVAIFHVAGAGGVQVVTTPGLTCGAPGGNGVTEIIVTCTPDFGPVCMAPHAFAMSADIPHDVRATAECGSATATCDTTGLPAWCMQKSASIFGKAPLVCTAQTLTGSLTDFTWWVECSQPV